MMALTRNLGLAFAVLAVAIGVPAARAAGVPNRCVGCNLSHMNLHGADLHGVDYVGTNLRESDLSSANLRDAFA